VRPIFGPSQQELSRYLKYMARARIPEFESDMPSHAVGLSQVRSPAIVMHRVALDGHEIHGGHDDSKRCNHLCPDCDHTHK
jgi:hypothetical protein